jgi:DNA-binding Lrp family transcriptional regulator
MPAESKKAVKAFILMNIDSNVSYDQIGTEFEKFRKGAAGRKHAYIKDMYVITGEYDLIAEVDADSNEDMLRLVTTILKPQSPQVVTKTTTCVAANSIWRK